MAGPPALALGLIRESAFRAWLSAPNALDLLFTPLSKLLFLLRAFFLPLYYPKLTHLSFKSRVHACPPCEAFPDPWLIPSRQGHSHHSSRASCLPQVL
jgi:hypothetical protein